MKDKPNNISQSGTTESTDNSLPQNQKGSITKDIDRYHNRFIDSKTESTASSKISNVKEIKRSVNTTDIKSNRSSSPPKRSVKSGAKAKTNPLVKISDNKGNTKVNPPKKTTTSPPKKFSVRPQK